MNILKYPILLLLLGIPFLSQSAETEMQSQLANAPIVIAPQHRALENALADMALRSKDVTQPNQLSYREQLTDNNGNRLSRYYDASSPPEKRWQQLEIIGADISQSQLQINIPLILSPSVLAQGRPEFYAENQQFWIFITKTFVNAENEGRQSVRLNKAANKLQNNLSTYIYVDKQTQQFTRLKIVNSKPFKPSALAKIEVFSVIVDYMQAWKTGPLVAVNSIRKLKGTYGLFMEINEQLTQELTQHSQIK